MCYTVCREDSRISPADALSSRSSGESARSRLIGLSMGASKTFSRQERISDDNERLLSPETLCDAVICFDGSVRAGTKHGNGVGLLSHRDRRRQTHLD